MKLLLLTLIRQIKLHHLIHFLLGGALGLLILILTFFTVFEWQYQNKTYPQISVASFPMGGKTKKEVTDFFEKKNQAFGHLEFTFIYSAKSGEPKIATISAEKLQIGYDTKLLADQAILLGRSGNFWTAILQKFTKINLPSSYSYDQPQLKKILDDIALQIDLVPEEALFKFENGRVAAFHQSKSGQKLDKDKATADFNQLLGPPKSGKIILQILIVEPKVKTEEANSLGIKELVAEGKSFFSGSIPNRVYNISLAGSRLNGLLIAPNEVFSFNQAVGEVSDKTGYKQAYVIKEKKTVLDDGGGVCQVSTTLFRAALLAGLPIIERQAHVYRVSYYEQGGFGPGLDATVYSPSVDLKIKNDTGNYLLIQTQTDQQNFSLTIRLYGTRDQRIVTIGKAKLLDEVKPQEDLYQDDPSLPKDQVKQIDFSAWGAKVSFDYKVVKNGEVLQNKTFNSVYQPWQAVYLRGTKE